MSVVVFVGSTLPVAQARAVLDADYRPPAAQGDVYRAARAEPVAIGLIDGYFSQVPAVWHKEILWAMSRGIHVFGSASMGALRAAELADFGMKGVGAVFEAYRDGEIEDDDEVAVLHGPAELGYPALSEAMVNIRASLRKAERQGVASPETCAAALRAAKTAFYPERSWKTALAGLDRPDVDSLRSWLEAHRVDQKRDDALAMLRQIKRSLAQGLPPKRVDYALEHSFAFEEMVAADQG